MLLALLLWLAALSPALGGKIDLPKPLASDPIEVRAAGAHRWRENGDDVLLLQGGVVLRQGPIEAKAAAAVVWLARGRYGEATNRLTVFLEGGVEVLYRHTDGATDKLQDASWYHTLDAAAPPKLVTPPPLGEPEKKPPIFANALLRRNAYRQGAIRRTKFELQSPHQPASQSRLSRPSARRRIANQPFAGQPFTDQPLANPPPGAIPDAQAFPPGTRRLRAFPRSSTPINVEWFPNDARGEWIAIIDSGVNLIIDGVAGVGAIDVSTDRMVIWTAGEQDLTGQSTQSEETPLEIYMEGNIVFRQGERIVYAERMYYDVRRNVGVILRAELLSPVEGYEGTLRVRADVVQQVARGRFVAQNAYVTSSRFGVPGYRLSAETVLFDDEQFPRLDAFGAPLVDPATGEEIVDHRRRATSFNNLVFVEEVPVFYWPVFASNLEKSQFYIRRAKIKSDSVFGTQLLTTFDTYQVLGLDPLEGTDWTFNIDIMSERGVGHGTKFEFAGNELFGVNGPYAGFIDYWGIQDHGLDNLGGIRRRLIPEKDYRFRLLSRARWLLPDDWQLTAEVGWISDRNFLEQYFEYEWDRFKDRTTGVELKKIVENWSFSAAADIRLDSSVNQIEHLPRLDAFTIGESLLGDWLTWHQHTSVGYFNMRAPRPPGPGAAGVNSAGLVTFAPLPWETVTPPGVTPTSRSGERLITRHEIDLPLKAGPVKVVPYVLGEAGHWGEDLNGNNINRLYGQLGVRTSLSMWALDPCVKSDLLDITGLAHKVTFELDASISESNQDLASFPLYEPVDDDNVEAFRRIFQFTTFGPAAGTPTRFDERFYALRSGLGDWVTAPAEIADDLSVVRFNVRQRWQTKRGFPGQKRTRDFVLLNSGVSMFPNRLRENQLGQPPIGDRPADDLFGLWHYDVVWHVGDRTSIFSQGMYDFFNDGQALTRVGFNVRRIPRGNLQVALRSLQGPFDSEVLQFSYSYWMSPKWISSFSTGYDFGESRNIGQRVTLLRVGESFLLSFNFNVDASKGSVGFNLSLQPRFLPAGRLGNIAGVHIPPAGVLGLE